MSKDENTGLIPSLRFPEFKLCEAWQYINANKLFKQISNKEHNSELPILAITQDHGAIPRDLIDYNVSVTEKSVKSYKVVEKGDFIISLRSFQGGIEYSKYKGICSPAYVILRKEKKVDGSYFKYYFKTKSFIRDLTKNLEGLRDGKMISYKQFSEVLIPLPSLEEQKRISDFLSSFDNLILAQKAKLDILQRHQKALREKVLPKRGQVTPDLRFSEFRCTGEWNPSNIGAIAKVASGGTPTRAKSEYWNGDIPWVTTTLVNFDTIYNVNEFITDLGLKNSSAKIFPKNTILMAMYGQGKTRGQVALLGIKASINQACAAFVLKNSVSVSFVFQDLAARYEEIREISNDGGQKNLSATLIKNIPFSYPDIETGEQEKIADCLLSIDKLIKLQSKKIEVLKRYKVGLMQKLLSSMDGL